MTPQELRKEVIKLFNDENSYIDVGKNRYFRETCVVDQLLSLFEKYASELAKGKK